MTIKNCIMPLGSKNSADIAADKKFFSKREARKKPYASNGAAKMPPPISYKAKHP
jgi:hypothetical protein